MWSYECENLRTMSNLIGGAAHTKRYENYNPDSDTEKLNVEPYNLDAPSKSEVHERVEVEIFSTECLGHRIDKDVTPLSNSEESIVFDHDGSCNYFL